METVAEYFKTSTGEEYITLAYMASDELIDRVCKDVVPEVHHHAHH